MLLFVLLCLPWIAWGVLFFGVVRKPPRLPSRTVGPGAARVSVVIPARNEAHNIRRCVASLAASHYPDFEVVVVDDGSEDGTAEAARSAGAVGAGRVEVVRGEPLPPGWFGKQWACWQGARRATGERLLFTDADTVHAPDLLGRAVAELEASGADALTLAGTQLMGTFWEKLVQPQVFTLMAARYPRMGHPVEPGRWRSAIANGQYLLFRRDAYEGLGGHEAVRWEAAEDMRLAQRLVRSGGRLVMRTEEDAFATRMYEGLGELVAGWSKNVIQAGLQTLPPLLRPVAPFLMLVTGLLLWLAPPVALAAALAGAGGKPLLLWAAATTAFDVLFWTAASRVFRGPWWAGPLYPLGTIVTLWIVVRSWAGRRRVRWKGRSYAWDVNADVEGA